MCDIAKRPKKLLNIGVLLVLQILAHAALCHTQLYVKLFKITYLSLFECQILAFVTVTRLLGVKLSLSQFVQGLVVVGRTLPFWPVGSAKWQLPGDCPRCLGQNLTHKWCENQRYLLLIYYTILSSFIKSWVTGISDMPKFGHVHM